MDEHLRHIREMKIKRTVEALRRNNIDGYQADSAEELHALIKGIVPGGASVASGGSMTLIQTGVLDMLKSDFRYVEHDHRDLGSARAIFSADAFFCSANAITEDGWIYNVDGTGNRVAATLYGPEQVVIVAGANKIVGDLDEAINRCREIAGPANAKRLNRSTPCVKTGRCMNCSSPERICNEYVLIKRQRARGRIHVIFMTDDLGY